MEPTEAGTFTVHRGGHARRHVHTARPQIHGFVRHAPRAAGRVLRGFGNLRAQRLVPRCTPIAEPREGKRTTVCVHVAHSAAALSLPSRPSACPAKSSSHLSLAVLPTLLVFCLRRVGDARASGTSTQAGPSIEGCISTYVPATRWSRRCYTTGLWQRAHSLWPRARPRQRTTPTQRSRARGSTPRL